MYVIASQTFKTRDEAEQEIKECFDSCYRVYEVKEKFNIKILIYLFLLLSLAHFGFQCRLSGK